MRWKPGGWILIGMLLTAMSAVSYAQVTTTQVSDTVYHADGTPAGGSVLISWPAFTTSTGSAIPTGSVSVTIGTAGAFSVNLTPNSGAIPVGTYYTVVYHLDDGSVSRQYWVVPVSSSPVKIGAIESTVLPATIAMQTVSKTYVDNAIAAAVSGHPLGSSTPFVTKTGDTMSGPLNLPADPTQSMQAADKNYVDTVVAGVTSGLAQKVTTQPTGTQTVTQPTGSQLFVNNLNGTEYASQFVNGHGNNGIGNAIQGSDCVNGCDINVDRSYASGESYWVGSLASGTHVSDHRGGSQLDSFLNPLGVNSAGLSAGEKIDVMTTLDAATLSQQTGSSTPASIGLTINHTALGGGSNLLPGSIEAPPYFKMAYSAAAISGTYYTQGQHGLMPESINCFGVGDCLMGSRYITASGGSRDEADEGAHLYDTQVLEDYRVFQGTCITGCTTGSTNVMIRQDVAGGTQGDGRFLIDKNPAKTISSAITGGSIIGGANGSPHASVQFSGTNFPVSTFLSTTASIPSQGGNMAPGTVSVVIATTGVPNGFVTSTAAIGTTSGVACINDTGGMYYEMAPFTVVDGTHLQLTLKKPHHGPVTIAIGGLCGYGIEQMADTSYGIRQVFPVIGSYSGTGLYYESLSSTVLGQMNQTDAFLNVSSQIISMTRSGGVVTVATPGLRYDLNGLTVTIAGANDSSFNGQFTISTTGPTTFTFPQSGPDSTTTGGTVTYLNGGFVLYPMAEVASVLNPATRSVDGQMTLGPNTVAWAANDPVEEPHFFQEDIWADVDYYAQTVPRPTIYTRAGLQYGGNNSGSMFGWSIQNVTPQSSYIGYGGTHVVPTAAYESMGLWQHNMNMSAGEQSVFTVYCNFHGCGNWNSGYDLFQLQDATGFGVMHYDPATSNLSLNLRNNNFLFAPSGFTAGTINTTTLNAGTINGSVNAANVNAGTLPSSVLPLFGASGSAHKAGAVPDPGATQGSTRFLREDGTWSVPAGGGSGGTGSGGCSNACTLTGQTTLDTQGGGVALSMTGSNSFGTAFLLGGTAPGVHNWGFQSDQNGHWLVGDFSSGNYGFEAQIANGGSGFLAVNNNTALGWMANAVTTNGAIPDTAFTRTAAGSVALGNGSAGDASGSLAVNSISAALYKGPATAPAGGCSTVGWVFSQDGHATFCNGASWVQKF